MTRCVALVCRLSPRPDGSYEGVDLQERWGREYAARVWPGVPVEVFADRGISAANGDHRPAFERFRTWLGGGRIAHVWAVEQTRLERREVEWFQLAAEMDAAGVAELHTKRDGIVRVRDDVAGIKAVLAAGEVRRLRLRVNDRLAETAAAGVPPGGKRYGYRPATRDDKVKTLEVVDHEAAIIREAAERVLAGWGLNAIVADLRERGYQGPHGGTVGPNHIRSWLSSPTVAGLRVYRGEIIGRGNWPAILDETTWQAVKAKLDQPRRVRRTDGGEVDVTARYLGRSSGRRYLLTGGLTACGLCGAPLFGTQRKYGPYLMCRPPSRGGCAKIGASMARVEHYVLDRLWSELDRPEFLAALAADDSEAERERVTAALSDLDARRARLAAMWAEDELTATEWSTARERIGEREKTLRAELAAIPPPMLDVDIAAARSAWPAMTLDEQRELIGLFVERVVVGPAIRGRHTTAPERVTVEWRKR